MTTQIDPGQLHGRWLRARDEGTADQAVYLPATKQVRATRALDGLELRPDGTATWLAPAQTDLSQVRLGTWRIDDGALSITFADPETAPLRMAILEASPGRLVLKK